MDVGMAMEREESGGREGGGAEDLGGVNIGSPDFGNPAVNRKRRGLEDQD